MRKLSMLLLALVIFLTAHAQTFKRANNETVEKFIARITNVKNPAYSIVETKEWNAANVIIAFIPTGDEITVGLMFVNTNAATYQQMLIDSFSTFGNTAKIDTVFFANADSDKTKELIVMASYDQVHGKEIGKVYWNLIFDNPNLNHLPHKLKYLKKISKKIDGNYEGILNGQMKHATFKKASEVKAALKKLGY